ncbi:MAG: insulinase family protein [Candidatus Anammoximicrobium sp.]|nr:insulinase family protein [Candidatus Anammoximicrobium sp.]
MIAMMTFTCASFLAGAAECASAARLPEIPFEKYCLANGLQVILHEDHSTPIVAVNVWYHVGSKNERPGRTGFAHLFEHMMFQGTRHYDKDYFGPLQQAGGQLNGSTNQDRTNYWETVPSNYLELALWMESDRMGFLLPAMTQEKLDNQRDVVRNERRQSYENRPYGLVYEVLLAGLYPPDHPYSWPTIGSMADLAVASREDVADFFRRFYHPANASLCIAGDFDPAKAKRLVEKYFGPIPAGPKVPKVAPAPIRPLTEDIRVNMTDRIGLARLHLVWRSVPLYAPGDAELDVLADILAGGKTSRLYRLLVRDKQIAQDVQASQNSREIDGNFFIVVTARPGQSLAELEAAVLGEVARLQAESPSAEEVGRALARHESSLIQHLESVGGFGGRADQLNLYNVYAGDPGYLEQDFGRYLQVDPAAVQRVARQYLGAKKMVLEVTPGPQTKLAPDPREGAAKTREELAKGYQETPLPAAPPIAEDADRRQLPQGASPPKFELPPIHRRTLSNGMQVLVVENHELPSVSLNVVFPVGTSSDTPGKTGLSDLLAAVWTEGTQTRSSDQVAEALANIGARLSVSSDWDLSGMRLYTLKRTLPQALDVFADVLQNPAFPEEELARQRNIAIGRLMQVRNEPNALASLAVNAKLYGYDHPYGRPMYSTEASLKAIGRDDLEAFYRANVRPDRASLIAVGDVTPDEIVQALEKSLAGWKAAGDVTQPPFPPIPPAASTAVTLVDKPDAAQSVISVCLVGTERKTPDYFALTVMNSIFGGQFSSRLNMNLREDKGYTYGARTAFDWRVHQPGPFTARAAVQTAVTVPALVEFLKEFEGILGARPIGPEELEFNKGYLTRGYPARFETPSDVAGQLETLVGFQLPDDYFNRVIPDITAVTAEDVLRVAKKYLDREHLTVIVVGDRSKIEADLRALPVGKDLQVVQFDDEFHLVPVK